MAFKDHFSAVADIYASARPDYPEDLFDWIATVAPGREMAWEAGCGSGQATRLLASRFVRVHASDPSREQIAQAHAPDNVTFAVEPAERCSQADASVDVVCVAQALHWFEREAFFAECARVLRPGGVLVAWGYQDVEVPAALAQANAGLQAAIASDWSPERAFVDNGYADFQWPFPLLQTPEFTMRTEWTLQRLLNYYSSYSASRRYRERTGVDPLAEYAPAFARAWPRSDALITVRWPLFVRAARKSNCEDRAMG